MGFWASGTYCAAVLGAALGAGWAATQLHSVLPNARPAGPDEPTVRWRSDVGLTISGNHLSFASVPVGGRRLIEFAVRNDSGVVIEIGTVFTSCSCFGFHLPTPKLQPGAVALASATLDLSEKPEFRGRLSAVAEAKTKDCSAQAFELRIEVEVD